VLATKHTGYHNLWELCDRLGVEIGVKNAHHIKPVRQGDRSIIDMTLEVGHRGKMLESIIVVRKHLKLIHLSDLVLCDDVTLCQETLDASE
jgi:hypothetical protein